MIRRTALGIIFSPIYKPIKKFMNFGYDESLKMLKVYDYVLNNGLYTISRFDGITYDYKELTKDGYSLQAIRKINNEESRGLIMTKMRSPSYSFFDLNLDGNLDMIITNSESGNDSLILENIEEAVKTLNGKSSKNKELKVVKSSEDSANILFNREIDNIISLFKV